MLVWMRHPLRVPQTEVRTGVVQGLVIRSRLDILAGIIPLYFLSWIKKEGLIAEGDIRPVFVFVKVG